MPSFLKKYLCCLLCCISFALNAQEVHVLTNDAVLQIRTYGVLQDQHYDLKNILTNNTLPFIANAPLNTSEVDHYWIRTVIENPYPNNENYLISLSLPLNYSLYFLDGTQKRWLSRTSGPATIDGQRQRGIIPVVLRGNTKNVLYFKVDVRDVKSYGHSIRLNLLLNKEVSFDSQEQLIWLSWLICVVVLLSFSCYNLYIYCHLKDKIYIYGFLMQVGAIFFITSFKHFFNLFLPFSLYNMRLNEDGSIYYYSLNTFFLHIGVTLILSGLIQLSRAYLNTKLLLPTYDRLLKYLLYAYVAFALIPAMVTISGWYYLDSHTLFYDNIFVLFIVGTIFLASVTAYRRKIRAAKYFLLANTIPMVLAGGIAIYFIVNSAPTYTNNASILPELAILSQILTFAVALVARLRLVNEELKLKEQEAEKLETDIAASRHKALLIRQENQLIITSIEQEKNRNDVLQQKLEANERELVGNSLYIHQKNRLLADLRYQIRDIGQLYPNARHPALKNIESSLNDSQYLDSEWDKFKLHFEQVHPDFFKKISAQHPNLTNNEMRLYAYFHIKLSTKEIATLLNIEPASVRQAKARLNKKMGKSLVNL
jgi:hypothetical protein